MTSKPALGYRARARSSVAVAVAAEYSTDIAYTGFASAECTLGIASDGTIVVAPAFTTDGVGVLKSADNGVSWEPSVPVGAGHRRIQPHLYLDEETDRLYFHTARFDVMPPNPMGAGFDMSVSGDGGRTWTSKRVARQARDWAKVFGGPRVGSSREGRVIYMSAPTPFSTRVRPVARATHQTIWRSYDGGERWEIAGRFGIDPSTLPGVGDSEYVVFGSGVVAADGTVYIGGRYGTTFAVAVSDDEGETWSIRVVPGARLRKYHNPLHYVLIGSDFLLPHPVAVDDDGSLYAVWPDPHGILRGAWSADGGRTWSRPVVVSDPSVRTTRLGVVTASGSGRIAIAYYGRATGRAMRGYVARCNDFRVQGPVFVGAAFDDEDAPLYPYGFDPGYTSILFGGNLNEILGVRFTSNDDVVVSAAMHLRGPNKMRTWSEKSRRAGTQAVLGRLERRRS